MSTSFKTRRRLAASIRAMNTSDAAVAGQRDSALLPSIDDLPGPAPRWWGFPLLAAMKRDYLGFTADLQRRYGDLVAMRLIAERSVDVFSPEGVREVLVDNAAHLIRWERGPEVFSESLGRSVIVTEGTEWQRQRRMLHPAFTPRRVAAQGGLMVEAIAATFARELPALPLGGSVEVQMDTFFSSLAMAIILRTIFSSADTEDTHAAAAATQTLSEIGLAEMFWPMTLPDWLPLPGKRAKRHALRLLRRLVGGHIAARREMIASGRPVPTDDLLAMLLDLRDTEGPESTGAALSDAEVYDQCVTNFQAGHETTATALLWWSRLMAEHPDAAARARDEVDAVLGTRDPTAADLPALPWLTATLKETLRLYSPIAAILTRRATADIVVGGHRLPRGTLLRITPWVLQRDPRSFPEPDRFHPERFLPDAPPPPRGAWMAFGAGPRVCIGQHFAMLEMTLAAAMMLQRWTLSLPPDAPPAVPELNVTLRPRGGVRLRLTARERLSERLEAGPAAVSASACPFSGVRR